MPAEVGHYLPATAAPTFQLNSLQTCRGVLIQAPQGLTLPEHHQMKQDTEQASDYG